jgi:hypothetical protein
MIENVLYEEIVKLIPLRQQKISHRHDIILQCLYLYNYLTLRTAE